LAFVAITFPSFVIKRGGEVYKVIKNMYTSTFSYVRCYYTWLHIRKASILAIIPSIGDNEFWDENNMYFITNIIFYITFFFILYIIKKNFSKLVSIGTVSPKYQNNFLFNMALDYFNIVFYTILFLVILSSIWDCTYIITGEIFARTPLHYSRLFKLFIAFILYMLNIAIKRISEDKITKWDIIKFAFLLMPIIIQSLLVHGYLPFDLNSIILIFSSMNSIEANSEKPDIKTFIHNFLSRFMKTPMLLTDGGPEIDKYDVEAKCISPKTNNIDAMNNNSGGNSEANSSSGNGNYDNSGSDKGKQPEDNSGSGKGKEPEGSSKKDKGKQPAVSSDSESDNGKQSGSSSDSENDKEGKRKVSFWVSDTATTSYHKTSAWVDKSLVSGEEGNTETRESTSVTVEGSTSGVTQSTKSGVTQSTKSGGTEGTKSGTILHTVRSAASWISGVPASSEHSDVVDFLKTDPDEVRNRPSTSSDGSSSEVGEGTSTASRPTTAPEKEAPKPKEEKPPKPKEEKPPKPKEEKPSIPKEKNPLKRFLNFFKKKKE
jgi:hypothetical protein